MCRTLPEASWLALDPRSGAATDCQVLSTLRGEICKILRAVEVSQREGGERIARLGREGRIQGSVCLQCVRDDGGVRRVQRGRRGCSVIKLHVSPWRSQWAWSLLEQAEFWSLQFTKGKPVS